MLQHTSVPTALIPREGDSYVAGKRMLFPSPVSGRGSRLFSLVHVLVHLTSCILSIALLAEGLDHANNNALNNDGTALVRPCPVPLFPHPPACRSLTPSCSCTTFCRCSAPCF